jgi:hypothetical protein
MQTNKFGQMAITTKNKFRQSNYHIDLNLIGEEGCEYLSKAYWP